MLQYPQYGKITQFVSLIMNEDFTMFQTLYNLTFLYDLLHILTYQKKFISFLLQFVQGWAHNCHRLPGLFAICDFCKCNYIILISV